MGILEEKMETTIPFNKLLPLQEMSLRSFLERVRGCDIWIPDWDI